MTQSLLLLSTKSFLSLKLKPHYQPPFLFIRNSIPSLTSPRSTKSVTFRVNSLPIHPRHSTSSSQSGSNKTHFLVQILILFSFSSVLLLLRLFSTVLLPDFPARWHNLAAFSEEAEARTTDYPSHLWAAIVAYEDTRFFGHFGVDPVGIARAAVSLSARGGGSTITQQLVKNIFLKNERTLSRKLVEIALSVALERTISKRRILSCYIYWGHGVYGIESASHFYFGKHPSLITVGESALLAGIIPAPEFRSPFRDPIRGKTFQARVLKRMVDVGFLDIETALSVVKQPLHYVNGPPSVHGLSHLSTLFREEVGGSRRSNQGSRGSTRNGEWDWERESKIWEICEEMERWAMVFRHRASKCL